MLKTQQMLLWGASQGMFLTVVHYVCASLTLFKLALTYILFCLNPRVMCIKSALVLLQPRVRRRWPKQLIKSLVTIQCPHHQSNLQNLRPVVLESAPNNLMSSPSRNPRRLYKDHIPTSAFWAVSLIQMLLSLAWPVLQSRFRANTWS
jgi:hypothetical protein